MMRVSPRTDHLARNAIVVIDAISYPRQRPALQREDTFWYGRRLATSHHTDASRSADLYGVISQ
ncbi:MAG TPA: hypothetical protein VKQ36_04035 [Ktedonobacterales bacterium]|nr:hypothetical protein [Ktedonobacterales bacterium]